MSSSGLHIWSETGWYRNCFQLLSFVYKCSCDDIDFTCIYCTCSSELLMRVRSIQWLLCRGRWQTWWNLVKHSPCLMWDSASEELNTTVQRDAPIASPRPLVIVVRQLAQNRPLNRVSCACQRARTHVCQWVTAVSLRWMTLRHWTYDQLYVPPCSEQEILLWSVLQESNHPSKNLQSAQTVCKKILPHESTVDFCHGCTANDWVRTQSARACCVGHLVLRS